jgi:hypothetical protein
MVPYFSLAAAFTLLTISLSPLAPFAQPQNNSSEPANQVAPLPPTSTGIPYKTSPLPSVEDISPTSFHTAATPDPHPVVFLSEEQISASDRALIATAKPLIQREASFGGIDFGVGKWSYQQLECHALPEHLFLIYTRNNGVGDVSLFSTAISRTGKDRVRVIPIRRRGFSLFSPAPVNPLTIAMFNRIRAEEPASKNADWLSTSLCYAALTGAHPETSSSPDSPNTAGLSFAFPPTLEIGNLGESTVRFVDVAAMPQPMQWALTFTPRGELEKVEQLASPPYQITPLPPLSGQESSPQASR